MNCDRPCDRASTPISPPKSVSNNSLDVFPNDVVGGGAQEAATEPDGEEETFEEWALGASSVPAVATPAQKEQHAISGHVQYRSWCPHCLRIRGRANKHDKDDAGSSSKAFPILHWDYCYLCSTGDSTEEDEKAEEK